jgi:type 1 fimbriae regulatory protein FimB
VLKASMQGRHGIRDHAMVLTAFRHGLRVSELVGMHLSAFDETAGRLWVARAKGSLSTEQPMQGDEIRALHAWLRRRQARADRHLPYLFLSERGPFTRQAFNYLLASIGRRAGLDRQVYPHMLRHSCGFALADKGYDTRLIQDWLGHRNVQHTSRYTRTSARRFAEIVW